MSAADNANQARHLARKKLAMKGEVDPDAPHPMSVTPERTRWQRARTKADRAGEEFEHEGTPPYRTHGDVARARESFAAHPANAAGAELPIPDPVPRKQSKPRKQRDLSTYARRSPEELEAAAAPQSRPGRPKADPTAGYHGYTPLDTTPKEAPHVPFAARFGSNVREVVNPIQFGPSPGSFR